MKILFLPKYSEIGPSSRYRIYQYLPYYSNQSFKIVVSPLLRENYFIEKGVVKFYYIVKYYLSRLLKLLTVFKYDLIYIEYEVFPYFPSVFERIFKVFGIKYIVDYDDAIFHNYSESRNLIVKFCLKNKIDNVIKMADYVITGSPYLSNYVSKLNSNYTEIPTSVNANRYTPKKEVTKNQLFTIGWIGSKTTSSQILKIRSAFEKLDSSIKFQLNLIGFDPELKMVLKNNIVNIISWSQDSEIDEICKFDVGIMPLERTLFNQGKCGFKLIQYMGCAKPTISSPLEANVKINRSGKNLHATTIDQWQDAILKVYDNQELYKNVGKENHNYFYDYYTINANLEKYIEIFKLVSKN